MTHRERTDYGSVGAASVSKSHRYEPVGKQYPDYDRLISPFDTRFYLLWTTVETPRSAGCPPTRVVVCDVHTCLVTVLYPAVTRVADVSRADAVECRRWIWTAHSSSSVSSVF